jgi:hypothetical protein
MKKGNVPMEKMTRLIFTIFLICLSIAAANNAYSELVDFGYQAELNTQYNGTKGNGEFFIYNPSGSGTYITRIEVTWGDYVQINSITNSGTGLSFTVPGTGARWTSASAADLGFTSSSISADGKSATLNFSTGSFAPGETAAFNMQLIDLPHTPNQPGVGGEDMIHAIIKVYYTGQGGTTPELSSGFLTVNANDKKIYVSTSGTYDNGITNTPIPPTVFLLGAGFLGLVGIGRKFRK